ncbi:MAG: hypothetical protein ACPHK8_06460 [Thermoplasmatota archaeon]
MAWKQVQTAVLEQPLHAPVRVEKHHVPHPEDVGFYMSRGLNRSAHRHFRLPIADQKGLHVLEYDDHYLVHWDRIDPSVSMLGHFLGDVVTAFGQAVRRRAAPRVPVALVL